MKRMLFSLVTPLLLAFSVLFSPTYANIVPPVDVFNAHPVIVPSGCPLCHTSAQATQPDVDAIAMTDSVTDAQTALVPDGRRRISSHAGGPGVVDSAILAGHKWRDTAHWGYARSRTGKRLS